MKGAVMKVGQILSFVDADGVIPASYRQLFQSTLARLQDDVPPLAPRRSPPSSRPSSGRTPDELFVFFSPRPVAGGLHWSGAPGPIGRRH